MADVGYAWAAQRGGARARDEGQGARAEGQGAWRGTSEGRGAGGDALLHARVALLHALIILLNARVTLALALVTSASQVDHGAQLHCLRPAQQRRHHGDL